MRFAAAICALLISTAAQAQTTPLQALLGMPWSLGISLVQWISKDEQKVLYIEVTAEGANLEEARQQAFRMAVERAVGTVIVSETELRDQRIRRDEIITYASGYVTDYKLVDQMQRGDRTWVKMQIWVRHSAIANRLLGRAENTQNIDGLRLVEQVNSINYERDQAQRILSVVMADYPQRAFLIENQTIETRYSNRRPEIIVEFDLRFNRSYIYALWETLKTTAQSSTAGNCYPYCQTPYVVHIHGRNDGFFFNRWSWSMGFTEANAMDIMYNAMLRSQPGVMLSLQDGTGRSIYQECFFWAELDGQVRYTYPQRPFVAMSNNGDRMEIDGNAAHRFKIELRNLPDVSGAQKVKLEVVRRSNCS